MTGKAVKPIPSHDPKEREESYSQFPYIELHECFACPYLGHTCTLQIIVSRGMMFHDWPSLILIPLWVEASHDWQCETTTTKIYKKRRNIFPMQKKS